ncbi:hypothetical protein ACFBZI_11430 [Moraxella sp. ZJ142]|uniref:hypothetical protein n=1 Tax=Moraxella marmotae TaxID=3344520 RepID=UPI0035D489BC
MSNELIEQTPTHPPSSLVNVAYVFALSEQGLLPLDDHSQDLATDLGLLPNTPSCATTLVNQAANKDMAVAQSLAGNDLHCFSDTAGSAAGTLKNKSQESPVPYVKDDTLLALTQGNPVLQMQVLPLLDELKPEQVKDCTDRLIDTVPANKLSVQKIKAVFEQIQENQSKRTPESNLERKNQLDEMLKTSQSRLENHLQGKPQDDKRASETREAHGLAAHETTQQSKPVIRSVLGRIGGPPTKPPAEVVPE